jgi:uncharacterized ferritin-like protein (DUF455 family)
MELREYAETVVQTSDLARKLARPADKLSDDEPGPARRLEAPGRPPELQIAPARSVKVPPVDGMRDPEQRARILHALANHELQAAEIFAWALLAFPDAPPNFRRGLAAIAADEQRHCELYVRRLEAHGRRFGEFGVTGHFWNKLERVKTPLHLVCTMGLTFENANLDFAQEYARSARDAGDHETANVLDEVHADEVRHVRFAWHWFSRFKDQSTDDWSAYLDNVAWPLGPGRARGREFDRDSRVAAGMDDAFIRELETVSPHRPNGRPR